MVAMLHPFTLQFLDLPPQLLDPPRQLVGLQRPQ
jgi:hypothetical protein